MTKYTLLQSKHQVKNLFNLRFWVKITDSNTKAVPLLTLFVETSHQVAVSKLLKIQLLI